jgi:hypothetical protein
MEEHLMLHCPHPAALILACALTSSLSYAQLSFNPHQAAPLHSHSGIGPHGDFNGDGREDILASVLNPSTGNYNEVLYLSTADGTYDAPRTMPAISITMASLISPTLKVRRSPSI